MQKEVQKLDVSKLSNAVQLSYYRYKEGVNLRKTLSQSVFYAHRKELLKYGIDIAQPLNITQFPQQYKTITLTPSYPPDWYHLPDVEELLEG